VFKGGFLKHLRVVLLIFAVAMTGAGPGHAQYSADHDASLFDYLVTVKRIPAKSPADPAGETPDPGDATITPFPAAGPRPACSVASPAHGVRLKTNGYY
jgi:hypothetical protein